MNGAVSYTIVLTKGAHIVPDEDALAIQKAIENGEKLVNVRFEESPGSDVVQHTTLVTSHVIALYPVPPEPGHSTEISHQYPNVRSLFTH